MAHAIWEAVARVLLSGTYHEKVERHRIAYLHDLKNKFVFVPWVSVLYSCRDLEEYRGQLSESMPRVIETAELLVSIFRATTDSIHSKVTPTAALNRQNVMDLLNIVDVLSTILVSTSLDLIMSHFSPRSRARLRALALELLDAATPYEALLPSGHHGPTFFRLTRYEIADKWPDRLTDLIEAENLVGQIIDPTQRARAYRKIGVLRRNRGEMAKGLQFGYRALMVPHTTWEVKLKSFVALARTGR